MIEDLFKAAILGTVQGLTEFLPVSSTGHLIIAEDALGADGDRFGLAFDASIHLGTLFALLVYYRHRWLGLVLGGIRTLRARSVADDAEGRLAWLIVLGTIPAGVAGLVFRDAIEAMREAWLVAVVMIGFSAVFVVAERISKRMRHIPQLRWLDALIVGGAQAIALIPGVSRSGATISAGLFRDVERPQAATFAFLLSAPIIAAAGLSEVTTYIDGTHGGGDIAVFVTGLLCAAIVGYVAIAFLLRFLVTNTLLPFAVYRVLLGSTVLAVLAAQAVA